jgi:hypothetical protein
MPARALGNRQTSKPTGISKPIPIIGSFSFKAVRPVKYKTLDIT